MKLRVIFVNLLLLSIFAVNGNCDAQVTGGRSSFSFLNTTNNPHVTAMGGMVPASYHNNVSFMLQNPALLNKRYHNQLALSYNSYFADIGIMNLAYANHSKRLNTDFGLAIQYLNYGSVTHTDEYGMQLGSVRANDLSLNLSASRTYGQHWRYGATLKLANSHMADLNATALLADVGVVYEDTTNKFSLGIVAKNLGFHLKKYRSDLPAEPLPFDLQIGVMKGFANIPLRVFMVAHHLYEWDIRYDDPAMRAFDLSGNPVVDPNKKHFVDKLFRHLNFGAELTFGKRVTATVAYSTLKRSELGYDQAKGTAGFSMGLNIDLSRMYIQFGRSYFANAGHHNEFGIILPLNKLIKAKGKLASKGWNDIYP